MVTLLHYVQLFCALSLIGLILLTRSNTDAGGAFGSESSTYREKRGVEKLIHKLTILTTLVFVASFIVPLFL